MGSIYRMLSAFSLLGGGITLNVGESEVSTMLMFAAVIAALWEVSEETKRR